jgi:hypothetical protein
MLERIVLSVVLDVPVGIPTFLLDVAFFLQAIRTTLVSFLPYMQPWHRVSVRGPLA